MRNDHEFSRPREEFSPPPREFMPPPREYHRAGTEFDQPPTTVKKKKKGVNPLMLTAAAVAAAGVVLVSPQPQRPDLPAYPPQELCDENNAYLQEIFSAFDARDTARLTELLNDSHHIDVILGVVGPYYEMLAAEYDYPLSRTTENRLDNFWDETTDSVRRYGCDFYYDGTSILPDGSGYGDYRHIAMLYEFSTRPYMDTTTEQVHITFRSHQPFYQKDGSSFCWQDRDQYSMSLNYEGDTLYYLSFSAVPQWTRTGSGNTAVAEDVYSVIHMPDYETVLEGQALGTCTGDNNNDYSGSYAYLENGTVVYRDLTGSDPGYDLSVDVENGYTVQTVPSRAGVPYQYYYDQPDDHHEFSIGSYSYS